MSAGSRPRPYPRITGLASVVDAMEEMALDGLITGCGGVITSPRFHGRVATLSLAAVEPARPTREHWSLFDRAVPGSVLVIATGGAGFTVLGGVSAAVATARGVAGVVTDGAVRDIDEIEGVGTAVRFGHRNPRGCVGGFRVVDAGRPVVLGGRRVTTDDYLVSDSDGLVVIPAEVSDRVLARAHEIERHETAWAREAALHRSIAAGHAATHTSAGIGATEE